MRRVAGQVFEDSRAIGGRSLATAKFDARQWAKEDGRQEVLRALMQYYKSDFPLAMTHIVAWRETEAPVNLWVHPDDAPDFLPDVRITVSVVVEGFDVV